MKYSDIFINVAMFIVAYSLFYYGIMKQCFLTFKLEKKLGWRGWLTLIGMALLMGVALILKVPYYTQLFICVFPILIGARIIINKLKGVIMRKLVKYGGQEVPTSDVFGKIFSIYMGFSKAGMENKYVEQYSEKLNEYLVGYEDLSKYIDKNKTDLYLYKNKIQGVNSNPSDDDISDIDIAIKESLKKLWGKIKDDDNEIEYDTSLFSSIIPYDNTEFTYPFTPHVLKRLSQSNWKEYFNHFINPDKKGITLENLEKARRILELILKENNPLVESFKENKVELSRPKILGFCDLTNTMWDLMFDMYSIDKMCQYAAILIVFALGTSDAMFHTFKIEKLNYDSFVCFLFFYISVLIFAITFVFKKFPVSAAVMESSNLYFFIWFPFLLIFTLLHITFLILNAYYKDNVIKNKQYSLVFRVAFISCFIAFVVAMFCFDALAGTISKKTFLIVYACVALFVFFNFIIQSMVRLTKNFSRMVNGTP